MVELCGFYFLYMYPVVPIMIIRNQKISNTWSSYVLWCNDRHNFWPGDWKSYAIVSQTIFRVLRAKPRDDLLQGWGQLKYHFYGNYLTGDSFRLLFVLELIRINQLKLLLKHNISTIPILSTRSAYPTPNLICLSSSKLIFTSQCRASSHLPLALLSQFTVGWWRNIANSNRSRAIDVVVVIQRSQHVVNAVALSHNNVIMQWTIVYNFYGMCPSPDAKSGRFESDGQRPQYSAN